MIKDNIKLYTGFTETNFSAMLDNYNYNLNPGDIVAGIIFNQESNGFLVDIGAQIVGYLPYEETSLNNNYGTICINNQTREFFVMACKRKSLQLILSIKRLEYIRAWKRIKQIESEDIVLKLKVKKRNKGGCITLLENLQSFIPNSHLTMEANKIALKNSFINCKLLLADEKTNQLILSNKKAILSLAANKLNIGEIIKGTIIKIEVYGVFIELLDTKIIALLHISELGYKNIVDIKQIFNIGDCLKVQIIHVDIEQGRISVSRRDIS